MFVTYQGIWILESTSNGSYIMAVWLNWYYCVLVLYHPIFGSMADFSPFSGFLCNCVLPVTLNSTRIRHHHRIEDKVVTMEAKKELTSESTKTSSSNSSSSATSSPSLTFRPGRNRTRRAPPPSSPLFSHSSSSSSWRERHD